jgi:Caspase domain
MFFDDLSPYYEQQRPHQQRDGMYIEKYMDEYFTQIKAGAFKPNVIDKAGNTLLMAIATDCKLRNTLESVFQTIMLRMKRKDIEELVNTVNPFNNRCLFEMVVNRREWANLLDLMLKYNLKITSSMISGYISPQILQVLVKNDVFTFHIATEAVKVVSYWHDDINRYIKNHWSHFTEEQKSELFANSLLGDNKIFSVILAYHPFATKDVVGKMSNSTFIPWKAMEMIKAGYTNFELFEKIVDAMEDCDNTCSTCLSVLDALINANLSSKQATQLLKLACKQDKPNVAYLMMKKGADTNVFDTTVTNPSSTCRKCRSLYYNEYLIMDADVYYMAVMNSFIKFVERINYRTNNAFVNMADSSGRTPIFYVAQKGDVDMVKVLIKAGAQVNIVDNNGHMPSSYTRNDKILKYLKDPSTATKPDGFFAKMLKSSPTSSVSIKLCDKVVDYEPDTYPTYEVPSAPPMPEMNETKPQPPPIFKPAQTFYPDPVDFSVFNETIPAHKPVVVTPVTTPVAPTLSPMNFKEYKKVALVIGASDYTYEKLKKPVEEAPQVASALRKIGFTVTLILNPTHLDMRKGVIDFINQLDENTISYFHFSGHGIMKNNEHMLIPCNYSTTPCYKPSWNINDWIAIHVEQFMHNVKQTGCKFNIMIIDACRKYGDGPDVNDIDVNVYKAKGISASSMSSGMPNVSHEFLISYACEPCKVAYDGLYFPALINNLFVPNRSIGDAMDNVVNEVKVKSKGKQIPIFVASNYKMLKCCLC